MTAANAIRDLLQLTLTGWSVQFGHWSDPGPQTRSALIKPAGGPSVERVRRPQFTLSLIGLAGGDREAVSAAAEAVIAALQSDSGALVYVQAGEPTYIPTADGRPVLEIALSAIANAPEGAIA